MPEKEYKPAQGINVRKREDLILVANACANLLKSKYKVKRIFLIGSLVVGSFHKRSDIDLVVEGLPSKLYIKALTEIYDLLPSGTEVNLIPFEDAFDSLKEKTIKEGELICG